jgi:pimeloyl-ACP methyl ester carboxylesterase
VAAPKRNAGLFQRARPWRACSRNRTGAGLAGRFLPVCWISCELLNRAWISISSVQGIWRADGMQPHRMRQFSRSTDPQFAPKQRPPITVPTVVLHDESNVSPPRSSERHNRSFTGPYERRVVPLAGYFLPREALAGGGATHA